MKYLKFKFKIHVVVIPSTSSSSSSYSSATHCTHTFLLPSTWWQNHLGSSRSPREIFGEVLGKEEKVEEEEVMSKRFLNTCLNKI